jgi:hypothetical protein
MLSIMRTTLDIADDVMAAARALSERDRKSIGEIISSLARSALQPTRRSKKRNGIPLLPPRKGARKVDAAHVAALLEEV